MPEHMLKRCLELCRHARALDGKARLQALDTLEAALQEVGASLARPVSQLGPAQPAPSQPCEPELTMDLTGYLTGWNEGAERLFGYTAAEAVGRHVLFLY